MDDISSHRKSSEIRCFPQFVCGCSSRITPSLLSSHSADKQIHFLSLLVRHRKWLGREDVHVNFPRMQRMNPNSTTHHNNPRGSLEKLSEWRFIASMCSDEGVSDGPHRKLVKGCHGEVIQITEVTHKESRVRLLGRNRNYRNGRHKFTFIFHMQPNAEDLPKLTENPQC